MNQSLKNQPLISRAITMLKLSVVVVTAACISMPPALSQQEDPLPKIEKQLQSEGLVGLVHGADHTGGVYVFSYHLPGDFFARYNFSLLATNAAQKELLKSLRRSDRIRVHGRFGPQETPQMHILASKIEVLQKYDPKLDAPAGEWTKQTQIPNELKDKTEITAQVHAVAGDGQVIVVEYKDAILPLIVESEQAETTRNLYRGDVIRFQFEIQGAPRRPTHLILKPGTGQPLKVLERLVERHDKEMTIEGRLVLFPKSPTINMDVWAVEEKLQEGLYRYFTLVNFTEENGEFPELKRIDQKLRAMWNANQQSVFAGRNKFINLNIHIKATGKITVFDPNQANAQIHLTADKIQ